MNDTPPSATLNLARFSYLALLAWQWVWHALLPQPTGNANLWLALALFVPLVIPVQGVWLGRPRRLVVAGFIVLFYLIGSVMQAWVSEPQRWPALLQGALCAAYLLAITRVSAPSRNPG